MTSPRNNPVYVECRKSLQRYYYIVYTDRVLSKHIITLAFKHFNNIKKNIQNEQKTYAGYISNITGVIVALTVQNNTNVKSNIALVKLK